MGTKNIHRERKRNKLKKQDTIKGKLVYTPLYSHLLNKYPPIPQMKKTKRILN